MTTPTPDWQRHYDRCAAAALAALIAKVPLADEEAGDDAASVREEVAKSADSYARHMVMLRCDFADQVAAFRGVREWRAS